jgi:type IV pilus assembly protein PilC
LPEYAYEALTESGAVVRGAVTVPSEAALEAHLRTSGQLLIRADQQVAVSRAPAVARVDGAVDGEDLLAFTDYLAGSTQAGIPLLATLEDVETRLSTRRMRTIVRQIRDAMAQEGLGLSEGLARHPRAFSQLYIGTVEAGEATGHLDYALRQLVSYLDWQQEIRTQTRQATLYPVVVLVAVLGLILTLIAFVYPRLTPVLLSFQGVDLPWATRALMGTAEVLRGYWAHGLTGVSGLLLAIAGVRRTERGRYALDALALRIPVLGTMIREVHMARFVTYTALFYRTGVELIRGLILAEGMMDNRVVAASIRQAREAIVGGASLARAFEATGLFPPLVLRSLALGEATGALDEALGRAKAYYDRELPAAVRRKLTLLQPLLIVVLGGVIAIVALSIVLPILSIYQSIGR